MLYLLISLLFRINPSGNQKEKKRLFNIKASDLSDCLNLEGEKVLNTNYNNFLLKCSNSVKQLITFNNTQFSNVYTTSSNSKYMIFGSNINFNINNCLFSKCSFSTSMIYHKSIQYNLTMHSNSIINCFDRSNLISQSNIVYSDSHNANIQNNKVNFIDNDHACRAFYFERSTNTIFTKNIVKNANVNTRTFSGSGLTFHSTEQRTPLRISDCTFENCIGYSISSNAADLVILDSFILFNQKERKSSCGGISVQNSGKTEIDNVQFIGTIDNPALLITQTKDSTTDLIVNCCVFDSCSGGKFFDISSKTSSFVFSNNVVKNSVVEVGSNNYLGSINCNSKIKALDVVNMTVCDNKLNSNCAFGLFFNGISSLSFLKCQFINNKGHERTNLKGEATQFNSMNIEFIDCTFKHNQAFGNGGAVSIQTQKEIEFKHCLFDHNVASSRGKGGAIFISLLSDSLTYVTIEDCKFTSNHAFDGYAIYIKGDAKNTDFTIKNNLFIDNYDKKSLSATKSVIKSEISNLYDGKVLNENQFITSDNEVNVNPLLYNNNNNNAELLDSSLNKIHSLSNNEFIGELPVIHVNDQFSSNEVSNSRFIDCKIPEGEDFLFVVEKQYSFENIEFSFENSQIGAIKIISSDSVTIRNCRFYKCSSKGEFPCAISVIGNLNNKNVKEGDETKLEVIIEDLNFTQCGENGYAFDSLNYPLVTIRNILIEFESQSVSGGGLMIKNCGKCTVTSCIFKNTNTIALNYALDREPATDDSILIENSTFDSCVGLGCYIDIQPSYSIGITIENNTFNNCKKSDSHRSIGIGVNPVSDSIKLTIRDNLFHNCGERSWNNYILRIELDAAKSNDIEPIRIEDNRVHFDESNKGCIGFRFIQPNREFIVHNCSFYRCSQPGASDYLWENTLSMGQMKKFELSECKFEDCGVCGQNGCPTTSGGGNVIVIQSNVDECIISKCRIEFTNEHQGGSGISTYTDNILIEENEFIKCFENTIRVECKNDANNEFRLINNTFSGSSEGSIISFANNYLKRTPIIKDNTFKDITVLQNEEIGIIIQVGKEITEIEFNNNTFNKYESQIESFGIKINQESQDTTQNPLHLKYINCKFINNKQNKRDKMGIMNMKISYEECLFEGNEGEHYGGSLYINNYQQTIIQECQFISNSATKRSGGTNIFPGEGGCIYIKQGEVHISRSNFIENHCGKGEAIYINDNYGILIIDDNSQFKNNFDINQINTKLYSIQSNSEHLSITNTEFITTIDNQPESTYNYQCGFIYLTNSGQIQIQTCKFNNHNFRSSILYNIEETTDDNQMNIEGCEFNECLADVININLPTNSKETFNINNCKFEGCTGRNDGASNTIEISSQSKNIRLSIENNIFHNCGKLKNYNYVMKIELEPTDIENHEPIRIINNSIKFDDPGQGCIAIRIVQQNRAILIQNCSFYQCSKVYNLEKTYENCLSFNGMKKIEINECQFYECGKCSNDGCPSPSGGGNVIVIQSNVEECIINKCRIEFIDEHQGGSGISTYTDNILIEENEFIKCFENTILIQCKTDGENELRIINNTFTGSSEGPIISFWENSYLTKTPIIKDNTFKDITVLQQDEIGITIQVDQDITEIEFNNNTFNKYEIQLKNLGIKITRKPGGTTNPIKVKHIDSKFINMKQKRRDESDNEEQQFEFERCLFEGNEGETEGGSLYIKTNNEYIIHDCQFITNSAANDGSAIYISTSLKTSITNCEFINCNSKSTNSAYVIKVTSGPVDFDTCLISFDDSSSACGGIDLGKEGFNLLNCMFVRTHSSGSILFTQDGTSTSSSTSKISNCTFEECTGDNARCFSLTFNQNSDLTFKDVVVRKMKESGPTGYFGSITLSNKQNFEINNLTFTENQCNSLYGGGSGLLITGTEKITFIECQFISNTALQTKEQERPKPSSGESYYNGDGGGFQIGYSTSYYNVDLSFDKCLFKGNKAFRHGGGVALQTAKTITFTNCNFEENAANSQEKSNLLYDTYYHLKEEGRGGAIYINPTFSNSEQNDQQKDDKLTKIDINNCNFLSNSAFDGFAIYIEGDGTDVEFVFKSNKFIDNVKNGNSESDEYSVYRAVITSEVLNLYNGNVVSENTFSNSDGSSPNELLYVEHNGNPIIESSSSSETMESSSSSEMTESSSSSETTESSSSSETAEFSSSESEPLPTEGPADNCVGNHRCDLDNLTYTSFNITSTGFINLTDTRDGAAIHFINCALTCNDTYFYNCSSTNGGGGGIYIYLDTLAEKDVIIDSCTFVKCQSFYGGAIYAFSNVDENKIMIMRSEFKENRAITQTDVKGNKYGGSAIYISAKQSEILNCSFIRNRGKGGSVKFYNDFDSLSSKLIELEESNSKSPVSISNCKFEIDSSSSSCSIYYVRGSKKAVTIDVNNCEFNGVISNDAHHIDVKSLLKMKENPKLHIKSCRFSNDIKSAIKSEDSSGSLVLFDENNQVFEIKERILDVNLKLNNEKSNSKLFIIGLLSIAILAAIMMYNKTKNMIDNKIENDLVESNEIINQNLESLI